MEISNIMKHSFVTVNEDDTIAKALRIITRERVNGAPVVNSENDLMGMIVKADLYRFLVEEGHYDTYPVNAVMAKRVITARPDEDLLEVTEKLRQNDIMAAPVVQNRKVVGVISLEDIVDYFLNVK
ncbi:MAG: CBS domain-containing protein [Bacillota bacterium]|nr:CBS domain-containing protein [Bacillota bacterium]